MIGNLGNNNVLVVPSNRAASLQNFLSSWSRQGYMPWHEVVVVWDEYKVPSCVEELCDKHAVHLLPREKFADAGFPRTVFSRGSSACRCAGYLYALENLSPGVIFTIDDDCVPTEEETSYIVRDHINNLFSTPVWESTVPGYRVRGIPYGNQGTYRAEERDKDALKVMLSVGLWSGSPDLDAPTELHRMARVEMSEHIEPMPLPLGARVMSSAVTWPMSSMNMAWRAEFTPAMIMPPSGLDQVYDRFEDIWCGLLAQRVLKAHGWHATVGTPLVLHHRASDPFVNLKKEAPGLELNERLWTLVKSLDVTDYAGSVFARTSHAMKMLAESLLEKNGYPRDLPRGKETFTADWANVILDWLKLLQA